MAANNSAAENDKTALPLPKQASAAYRLYLWLCILLVLAGCLSRLLFLQISPPGFYFDESAGAAHIVCLAQQGADAYGTPWPFFSPVLAAGTSTPPFLYLGAMWTKLFGFSIVSFRSYVAFFSVLAILFLFLLVRAKLNIEAAVLASLCAAFSPPLFQFSRISWDPALIPFFLFSALYFFICYSSAFAALASGLLLAAAMYTYPCQRAQIPLLLLPLIWTGMRINPQRKHALFNSVFLISLVFFSLPLLSLSLVYSFMQRAAALSIINAHNDPISIISIFWRNYLAHFRADYLFLSGDQNLRHSTGFVGELSWMDCLALVSVPVIILRWCYLTFISKIENSSTMQAVWGWLLCLSLAGFFSGIAPAALTIESLPHALRSIGAWPFLALLSSLLLWKMCSVWRWFRAVI